VDAQQTRILAVDDEPSVRAAMHRVLTRAGMDVVTASSVDEARTALAQQGPFALILTDINMPGAPGTALLDDTAGLSPRTVAVVISGRGELRTAVESIQRGAYEYVEKPFDPQTLLDVTRRALDRRFQALEDLARRTAGEDSLASQVQGAETHTRLLVATQRALLRTMTHLTAFRDPETGRHLDRVAAYSRLIAQRLHDTREFNGKVDHAFAQAVFLAAPLHDVGKVAIPDHILEKAGPLTHDEMMVMRTHTTLGRQAILRAREELPPDVNPSVFDMAADVAGGHHEWFDGTGYPFQRRGTDIPLAARIVAVADYFDACTSARIYRPRPIPNETVFGMMEKSRGAMFDPVVLDAFLMQRREALDLQALLKD